MQVFLEIIISGAAQGFILLWELWKLDLHSFIDDNTVFSKDLDSVIRILIGGSENAIE